MKMVGIVFHLIIRNLFTLFKHILGDLLKKKEQSKNYNVPHDAIRTQLFTINACTYFVIVTYYITSAFHIYEKKTQESFKLHSTLKIERVN